MGVVRDVTIEQLTQAVQGISSAGMTDSTGQDIKDSIDALDLTAGSLGKDSSLQDIKTAIIGLGSTLGTDKANRDASNITDASAWRSAIGINASNTPFDNTGTPYTSSNVENALKELSIFTVEQKSFPIVYSSSTNPVSTAYYDVSKTGYTALGILSWAVVGASSTITYVNACALDTNISALNQLYFAVRATQQGSYTHNLLVKILYVKNS